MHLVVFSEPQSFPGMVFLHSAGELCTLLQTDHSWLHWGSSYECIHMHVFICVCACVCVHTYIYVCVCVHACVYWYLEHVSVSPVNAASVR